MDSEIKKIDTYFDMMIEEFKEKMNETREFLK